jgi:hypothetical protein
MRIVDRKFVDKTYTRLELVNTSGLLGEKPHVMDSGKCMYPRLTISNLTEGLKTYTNKKSEGHLRQSTLMQSNGESM